MNKKAGISAKEGGFALRVSYRAARSKKSARCLVRCGCCEGRIEIYYSDDDDLIEINGVMANRSEWMRVLQPLLKTKVRRRKNK
jgi:hypothetical protein